MQDKWMTFDGFDTLMDWWGGFRRMGAPLIDERIAEIDLEADDLAWAKPLGDEGLAAPYGAR